MTDREFYEQEHPNTLTKEGEILDCATVRGVFYAAVRQKDSREVWALVVLMRRSGGYFNFTYKVLSDTSGPVEDRCPIRILDLLTPLSTCSHDQEYCRLCNAEITPADGQWLSHARPAQRPEVAGPRCYSGYPYGANAPDGGAPFHEPGGTATCSTCWARDWRDRCRANAERETQARTRARTVRPGTCLRFTRPMQFSNGEERDTFTFETRSTFRSPDSDRRYRIPRWRTDYDYEIVNPTQS
ncbi:hypothetical protein DQ384_39330 [Sphaerisporangium album]|uniref:DUF6927 domain-containing protein n=2 Tax=Sphaerisporangium album TaxID=509200 RepID=A0A367ELH7_9ACTN|nr:hypothetical protein DQ384_39330 [Sphaerisporangium album]